MTCIILYCRISQTFYCIAQRFIHPADLYVRAGKNDEKICFFVLEQISVGSSLDNYTAIQS
jgi:hypothetical protein